MNQSHQTTTMSSSSSSFQPPPPFLQSAAHSLQSLSVNILSRLPSTPNPSSSVTLPFFLPFPSSYYKSSLQQPSSTTTLPSTVRMDGLGKLQGGNSRGSSSSSGPAFMGHVFTMQNQSGTRRPIPVPPPPSEIPFLRIRTPELLKKMFAKITKSEQNGSVYRFFMDVSDAVSYMKKLNIPASVVGPWRLDRAYEHFKAMPHMVQFVPNEKQVKEANRLLKEVPSRGRRKKVDGVPVFTAQNLNIAIATTDGIKWYIPYFFDKRLLDNILEASVDQHFHTLIQNRHVQRRRDVIDDGLTTDVVEENVENLFEPSEVQEVLDEMGHSDIPLSVISKAAEIQFLDVVDKVLLGNKWLRKATGIQPKFPYLVDSFEERSAAAFTSSHVNSEGSENDEPKLQISASENSWKECARSGQQQSTTSADFNFPFGDWFSNHWSRQHAKPNTRVPVSDGDDTRQMPPSPLLPKITMVGISTAEGGQISKANLKKTMEDLTKELEQSSQRLTKSFKDQDPLFVANVGDYSSITRMHST